MCDRRAAIQRPRPVHPSIEFVGQQPNFVFRFIVVIKIGSRCEKPGDEERRIDGGQFTIASAPPRFHVEEVVVEALKTCAVRLRSLRARPEKTQCGQHILGDDIALHNSSLDNDRSRRKCHPNCGDTGGRIVLGPVADQSVGMINLMYVVIERHSLEGVQVLVFDCRRLHHFALSA
jgi:hypothetical protein